MTLAVAAMALAQSGSTGCGASSSATGLSARRWTARSPSTGCRRLVSAPGFTETETVDVEMRRAMCMLLTSRREGYGLVVVEAAARGTPSVVVAGEDNAATELIDEGVNGTIARRADPESVAEAIVRVHEPVDALRESTATWFAANAESLSLESSLRRCSRSTPPVAPRAPPPLPAARSRTRAHSFRASDAPPAPR